MAMAPLKPQHALEQLPDLLKLAAKAIIPWHVKGIDDEVESLKTVNKNSSQEDIQAVYDVTIANARRARKIKQERDKKKSIE